MSSYRNVITTVVQHSYLICSRLYTLLYFLQELHDADKMFEQSEAENVTTVQDPFDLHDKSISLPMESSQESWPNFNPANQTALKQHSNEDDTRAQSESGLKVEASSDNKLSGSMERDDASLKQSKLGSGVQSHAKPFGSLETNNVSMKQRWQSSSNSIPSKHIMKGITPFEQNKKYATGKHAQTNF